LACSRTEVQFFSFLLRCPDSNGAPEGLDHCDSVGCARENVASVTRHELCRAVHAEQNAIIQAALHGISI